MPICGATTVRTRVNWCTIQTYYSDCEDVDEQPARFCDVDLRQLWRDGQRSRWQLSELSHRPHGDTICAACIAISGWCTDSAIDRCGCRRCGRGTWLFGALHGPKTAITTRRKTCIADCGYCVGVCIGICWGTVLLYGASYFGGLECAVLLDRVPCGHRDVRCHTDVVHDRS